MIISGAGGQGSLFAGKLLACAKMRAGLQVTYLPAYGAEVRGGTACCQLVFGREPIPSPLIQCADAALLMNQASMNLFQSRVRPGGLVIYNAMNSHRVLTHHGVSCPAFPEYAARLVKYMRENKLT